MTSAYRRRLAVLDEADVIGILAEAATANVQIVLTNETRVGSAGAAILQKQGDVVRYSNWDSEGRNKDAGTQINSYQRRVPFP